MSVISGTPRITAVAINKYIRKLSEPIMVNARLLGVLKAKGRITFNHDSSDIRWRVRYKRATPTASVGYPINVTFDLPNRITTAVLPWRSYVLGEAIPKLEKLIGRNDDTAFPRLVENTVKWMMEDFQYYFQRTLYADGEGGTYDIHGLESFFGYSGLVSSSKVGNPNDTYAGLSTALGGLGGALISGYYPEGVFDPEYAAWSPIIVDWDNSAFDVGTSPTWGSNWRRAVRYGRTWLQALQGVDPDIMIMHPEMERAARDATDAIAELQVTAKSQVVDLGIKTLMFEGLEMLSDPFAPAKAVYLLTTDKMELMSMQSQLVELHKTTDPYATDTLMLDFFGNLRVDSPAFFVKLADIS